MIQCKDCEFFTRGAHGEAIFRCDPFSNIKEPECLGKWQLIKIDTLVRSYQATVEMYRRLAPLQEKMFKHIEREINEAEEADSWKFSEEDNDEVDNDDGDYPRRR